MQNILIMIEVLEKRNEELKPKIYKDFDSLEELVDYKNNSKEIFTEYTDNLEKIMRLKWELLPLEKRIEKEKKYKELKEKFYGKSN